MRATVSFHVKNLGRGDSPSTKLQAQKKPCMGYNLQAIVS